ncbi:alpha/beta hydrolase [Nocardia sp. NPDC051750]|uniref:alpha/beta hydrolase n=1 Tax=Nocardia sp. NPDC051750 TaxID=3364325 RepID=UPI0037BB11F9
MLLPDIRWWNELALEQLETSLSRRITTIDDVNKQLADIRNIPGWSGDAADAAQRRFADTSNQLTDEAAALGAVRAMTAQARAAVAHLKATLADIDRRAAENGLEVWDAGHVTIADKPDAPDSATVEPLRLELIDAARAVMRQADDIIADAAAVLNKAADGKIDDGGATDTAAAATAGETQGALTALAPPENATPEQNNAYWNALGDQQRREVIEQHPEWIGNRDGIPSMARHEANVNRIDDERARLILERDRLQREIDESTVENPNYETDLAQVQAKLKDLDALEATLQKHPLDPDDPNVGARLLLLDMQSGDKGMAAIAIGDPDNAAHISVTTPGVSTTIPSLDGMAGEAVALQQETVKQLDEAGRSDEPVAAIAWLGYEPPPEIGPDAANAALAEKGAPKLAGFFAGLDAASNREDPHITALGHSYGSVTTALALQHASEAGVVDDAVFYGSPGVFADDEADLGLAPGRAYVMRAHDDPIVFGDGFGVFGPDPVTTNLEQLSVLGATTPDGVSREDSNGHSEYPRPSANGELRTAAYNMAVVIAGLPHLAVR